MIFLADKRRQREKTGQAGLSLLELVVYIGTASIALIGVIALFQLLANNWVRVQARARVEEQARVAVERMRYEIERGQAVIAPTPGATGNTLTVDVGGTDRVYSGHAWSGDGAGWLAFRCDSTNAAPTWDDCNQTDNNFDNFGVTRSFDSLSGFAATANSGFISMNCSDSPTMGGGCQSGDHLVTVDAGGNYHGWAWGEGLGWISFNCENTGSCFDGGASTNPCGGNDGNWRVCETWDATDGRFELHGWAWSDAVGWISFNGDDRGGACSGMEYCDWAVVAGTAGTLLTFQEAGGQMQVLEGAGTAQPLTDTDVLVERCGDGSEPYFQTVANPAPARAAVSLCFKATYQGKGSALTQYSTEVRTTFQLR
jgi:hypothetical protein